MRIVWTPEAWEDYLFWQTTDKSKLKRINELLREMQRTPFAGKGKPESLRFELSGYWSRRIDLVHRLDAVENNDLVTVKCRHHS